MVYRKTSTADRFEKFFIECYDYLQQYIKWRWAKLSDCTADYRPVFSSDRAPHKDRNFQKATFQQEAKSGHKSQSGIDTKTYWLTVSRKVT
jgi:hypothetical protein